jgi:4'-phosphopantetheinyl transferase
MKGMASSGWARGGCPYDPGTDEINLWRVDISAPELDSYQACLSVDERQRADKFMLSSSRDTFVRSRCALRLVLARCLDRRAPAHAGAIAFRYGAKGKPELADPAFDDFQFNLSHSENIALIVVARNRRVGVDVNHLSRTTDWQAVAKRSFSPRELSLIAQLSAVDQALSFHRVWAQKEAYTKAIGDGYAYGFQDFSVVVGAGSSSGLLEDDSHQGSEHEWNITSINAGSDCVAALAYDGAPIKELRQWEFCLEHQTA